VYNGIEMSRQVAVKVLRTAVLGAAVGGAFGAASLLLPKKKLSHVNGSDPDLHNRIINLSYAPDAEEALYRMLDYKVLDPSAYDEIRLNLDRLIGIYILVSKNNPVNVSYEIKANRYRHNIENAIQRMSSKYFKGQPSKQFSDDIDMLLKCADNYLYNIRATMHEKFSSRSVKAQ
jgi:hypothetical protein